MLAVIHPIHGGIFIWSHGRLDVSSVRMRRGWPGRMRVIIHVNVGDTPDQILVHRIGLFLPLPLLIPALFLFLLLLSRRWEHRKGIVPGWSHWRFFDFEDSLPRWKSSESRPRSDGGGGFGIASHTLTRLNRRGLFRSLPVSCVWLCFVWPSVVGPGLL